MQNQRYKSSSPKPSLIETFMQDYEIHNTPHAHAPAYSTGGSDFSAAGEGGGDANTESNHPFAISIRNEIEFVSDDDPDGQFIRSDVLRITVNGGQAEIFGKVISFSSKNFSIPFTEDGITKVYAEVELSKQNFTFSLIGNSTIGFVTSNEPDQFGVGHVARQTASKETRYQMLGTINVTRKGSSFIVRINQLIGGNFSFGQDVGTDSDENGINTRPGSKEFIATVNDKLYTVTVDVSQMKAVTGS